MILLFYPEACLSRQGLLPLAPCCGIAAVNGCQVGSAWRVVQDKPKPPMKCVPIGKNFPPNEGADKWVLKKDHTVEVLDDEFKTIAEGGWRNKVHSLRHFRLVVTGLLGACPDACHLQ